MKTLPMRGSLRFRNEFVGSTGKLEREEIAIPSDTVRSIDIHPIGFEDRTNTIQLSRVVVETFDGETHVFNASWMD